MVTAAELPSLMFAHSFGVHKLHIPGYGLVRLNAVSKPLQRYASVFSVVKYVCFDSKNILDTKLIQKIVLTGSHLGKVAAI